MGLGKTVTSILRTNGFVKRWLWYWELMGLGETVTSILRTNGFSDNFAFIFVYITNVAVIACIEFNVNILAF